jgi:formate C-acetyltransferase
MYFLPGRTAYVWAGHPVSEQPTIGGIDAQAGDACNDITELILEVEKEINLPQPDIAVMVHPKIKRSVLQKACETLPLSMKPKFFNYDLCAKQSLERGMHPGDLTDLVDIGCVAIGPQGKVWGNNGFAFFNLCKVLELALNNGLDPQTGKRIGPQTGDPVQMEHFAQLQEAYRRQLDHAIRLCVTMINVIEKVHGEMNPQALASMLIDDCIDKGQNVWQGGARYNIPGVEAVGLANVADSLAAIKKFVFEERTLRMGDLLAALCSDFTGPFESLRNRLIHDAPKYGNDEDSVDSIAAEVAEAFCTELKKHKGQRGHFCPSLASVSAHVGLGGFVGALPDGRKAHRPLADGMSPAQGICFCGPTAVIKSVTKIDHAQASDGTLLNMKFNATTFTSPEKREKFINLLETYMDLGGYHVQFNVIDTAKLRDAQLHPENYPDLLVRVAAYVAQFRQLPKELQDDIIARSEFE